MNDHTIIERKSKYDANKNHTKSFEMVPIAFLNLRRNIVSKGKGINKLAVCHLSCNIRPP